MHIRKALRLLALGVSLGIGSYSAMTPADAFFCANCATNVQQLHQYAKELETALNTAKQLKTQMQQYEDMVKQGLKLPQSKFQSVTSDLKAVTDLYTNTQSIGRSASNLDQQFRRQYPGFEAYLQKTDTNHPAVPDLYKKWSEQGMDNARTAMSATSANTAMFKAEDSRLSDLVSQSQSAQGRMQAIQAGNQIAAQNVQQIQKLRDLVATQITMQTNYMAQQQERQAQSDAFTKKFMSGKLNHRGVGTEF